MLKLWLEQHNDIDSFTLHPVTELSELYPRIGDRQIQQPIDNETIRDRLFKAIK